MNPGTSIEDTGQTHCQKCHSMSCNTTPIKRYKDIIMARNIKISNKLTLSHASSSLQLQNEEVTGVLSLQKNLYTGCGLAFQNYFFYKLMKNMLTATICNPSVNQFFPIDSWVVMNLFILSALISQIGTWILLLWYGLHIGKYSFS